MSEFCGPVSGMWHMLHEYVRLAGFHTEFTHLFSFRELDTVVLSR